jgi:large subunit ribosomal protein L6
MIEKVFNRNSIKVPNNIICYLCCEKKFLLIKGKIGSRLIKLEVCVSLLRDENLIFVTNNPIYLRNICNLQNKIKGLQSITKTLIKKAFIDVTRRSYKKLKLIGVGFRVAFVEFEQLKLLKFELGYSHNIYFKIPDGIEAVVNSPTKIIISGTSSDRVGEVTSKIRKLRLPEPYKGKGILYDNEKVLLKVVKKS